MTTEKTAPAYHRSVLVCLALSLIGATDMLAAERITIEVRETAGIRRFSHPVAVALELPEASSEQASVCLLEQGKPHVAQFRVDGTDDDRSRWWLDFQTSLAPFESKSFTVEYGPGVPTGPEQDAGHQLTILDDAFRVANGPYISWLIPRDLDGLLRSVNYGQVEHMHPESPGLVLLDRDGAAHPLGSVPDERGLDNSIVGRVVREGPLAVALRFEATQRNPELRGVRSVIDIHLPVSRSWVEVDWQVIDPEVKVSSLQAELQLDLDAPTSSAPTLVDFGATTMVYTALRAGQQAELRGTGKTDDGTDASDRESGWQVLHGPAGRLGSLVDSAKDGARDAEGWAHVMDRKWCLAMAVDKFARRTDDRIHLSAEGTVLLGRSFGAHPAATRDRDQKRFRFWLHFVNFPPQHGAATSPQSMQNPLEVRVVSGQ